MGNDSEETQNKIQSNVESTEFNNEGDVYVGSENEQIAKKIKYKGERQNNFILENVSIKLTNNFTDLQIGLTGSLSVIGSFITIWAEINGLYGVTFPQYAMYIGIAFAFLGVFLLSALAYKYKRKCPECGELYGLEEYKDPDVEKIEEKKGTRIITERHFKCQECGHTEDRTSSKFEEDESGSE